MRQGNGFATALPNVGGSQPPRGSGATAFPEAATADAGTLAVWFEPFVTLRVPKLFNLRTDPFERADITSITYYDWFVDHVFLLVPAQAFVGEFLQTFREYPQRQKAASFNLDEVLRKMQEAHHT